MTKEILVCSDNELGDEFVGQRVEIGTIERRFGASPQIPIYLDVSGLIILTCSGMNKEHTVEVHMIANFLHGITDGWVGVERHMVL